MKQQKNSTVEATKVLIEGFCGIVENKPANDGEFVVRFLQLMHHVNTVETQIRKENLRTQGM